MITRRTLIRSGVLAAAAAPVAPALAAPAKKTPKKPATFCAPSSTSW
ncbi:hypothetical protein ACTXKL_14090 [Brachybacterium tyrofermentans]